MPIRGTRQRPWLDFACLAWVSISGILWLIFGGPAWQAVLIALVAIGFSASAGRLPFRRTPFDPLLLLFILTALLGVWAAYDRAAAWDKFWVLTLSVLIYYTLASQPRQNWQWISVLICLWGVIVGLNFLLANDWQTLSADFGIITRIGLAWMAIRPSSPAETPAPNILAGILAGFFPFTLALGLAAWRGRTSLKHPWLLAAGAVLSALLLLLAIFLTSSRGAWLALSAGLGFWLAWQVAENLLRGYLERRWLALILGGLGVVLALGLLFALPGGLDRIFASMPGLPTGQTRLGIDRLTLPLVADYPFTGGGLGAFPGLFSQYMLVIPHFMFAYSHNLYLDVALEQGLAGLALLLAVYLGSAVLLFRSPASEIEQPRSKLLRQAALASLVIAGLHGLVDDPFYGVRATPFLWVLPGIAAFSYPAARSICDLLPAQLKSQGRVKASQAGLGLAGGLLLIAVAAVWLYGPKRLAAVWMANWGAIQLAQAQLRGFPTNEWVASQDISPFTSAQAWLERAVRLDPSNRTANHRLGLIALQGRDFERAVVYLDAAHKQDASHPGVIKNLGYAYVWAGKFDQAQPLLSQTPGAAQELGYYIDFWKAQGRADLALYAAQMRTRLGGGTWLGSRQAYVFTRDQYSLTSIR